VSPRPSPDSPNASRSLEAYKRYCLAEEVVKSASWDQLFTALGKLKIDSGRDRLFRDFKILYICLIVQHDIAALLYLLYKANKLKNCDLAKKTLIKRIKSYRRLPDRAAAIAVLDIETQVVPERMFSPRILFHIAGFSFRDCISMLSKHAHIDCNSLIQKLHQLNTARNTLAHRLFSGSTDVEQELREGLAAGADAWASLRRLLKKYDAASPS
jgi:hypothetical protein